MLLVVNYHYVAREESVAPRAIHPITLACFEAQVDELGHTFEFVGGDDVARAAAGEASLPDPACLLTFDDGLRDQIELALPSLDERGVPALFFVCGQPLVEPRVMFAHKVHLVREAMSDESLRAALGEHLDAVNHVPDSVIQSSYRYDTLEIGRLKYLLNVVLGPTTPQPIDAVFAELFSEREVRDRLYADADQVAELASRGYLGSHGYAHLPLAVLSDRDARADAGRGASTLAELTGVRPRAFSYPYGTPGAVTAASARAVAACGFEVAFTLERAFNTTFDTPLLLARLDTNDVPGGTRPLFEVDSGEVRPGAGMTPARTRYISEPV